MQEQPCRCHRHKKGRLYYQLRLLLVSLGLLYTVISPTIRTWLQEQGGKLIAVLTAPPHSNATATTDPEPTQATTVVTDALPAGESQVITPTVIAQPEQVEPHPVSSNPDLTPDQSSLFWLYAVALIYVVVFIAMILSFKWGRFTAPPPPPTAQPNQPGDKSSR